MRLKYRFYEYQLANVPERAVSSIAVTNFKRALCTHKRLFISICHVQQGRDLVHVEFPCIFHLFHLILKIQIDLLNRSTFY